MCIDCSTYSFRRKDFNFCKLDYIQNLQLDTFYAYEVEECNHLEIVMGFEIRFEFRKCIRWYFIGPR